MAHDYASGGVIAGPADEPLIFKPCGYVIPAWALRELGVTDILKAMNEAETP